MCGSMPARTKPVRAVIAKTEIIERAGEWNLRPEVVEKDYVLGWVLAALSQEGGIRDAWILKGGTCVKKCFFETYRFSEDLDFTLLPSAAYDAFSIAGALRDLAERTQELSGLRFNPAEMMVKAKHDRHDRPTFEGRIGYQGPLGMPGWPRIRFDITQHEQVVVPAVSRSVLHPYSDTIPADARVHTYAFEELLAEKTRALFERTRPRDLYDVVYILDNLEEPLDAETTRTTFAAKCRAKGFEPPTATEIVSRVRESAELRSDWDAMLAHQLPYAAPVEGAIERLVRALEWLVAHVSRSIRGTATGLATVPNAGAGGVVAPRGMHGSIIDRLRFAGANRLLVQFDYHGRRRRVEPYSLRWASTTGNLNFYGWEAVTNQIKAFTVNKMSAVQVLTDTFVPKYNVELAKSDAIGVGRWRW
ncbi:MAG: nucleotidyl transferase AbiEii/AbiGii toxin family protein [Gemmatimonadaceae bacterium]